ncbi:hypothetical protein [Rhizobium metallidurans]|uniref:Uncharacterized protein n=1 Tax=Rhizobium metallidurans TaxID=1265931 RepID=A0A7W6GF41_9HYPH|nr:hypothetical protein [Rhizobium metallidurans]MBB3967331.1 hypothetical protein [Rhizobium metallidurans]
MSSEQTTSPSSYNLSTSAQAIAVATASDPVEFDDVPSLGADHGAADEAKWHEATIKVISQANGLSLRSDKAARQSLAMVLIDVELHRPEFFQLGLKQEGFSEPANKDVLTLGIAFHYRLDVGHKDVATKTNNSKMLNRLVSAARYIKSKAIDKTGKLKVTFDKAGVEQLMTIIKEEGGINASMEKYLAAKKGTEKTDLIILDEDLLAAVREERYAANQPDDAELVVGFGRRGGDNSVSLINELTLTAAVKRAIAAEFKSPEPKVAFLRQLLQVKRAVIEEKTNLLINHFDDINDKSAPRRRAHSHVVFNPGKEITISPILSDASVVVRIVPTIDLLGSPVVAHIEFRTQNIRSIEANLTADRIDAFQLSATSTPGLKSGIVRLTLSSDVAVDPSKTVDLLVQQVYSKTGNLPLTLENFVPSVTLDSVDFLPAMKQIADGSKDAIKKSKPVTITAEPGRLTCSVLELHAEIIHEGSARKLSTGVRADDFQAVTAMLVDVKDDIIGGISLGIHADMLQVVFATQLASYQVHIPKQTGNGTRSDKFMRKLVPVMWPGLNLDDDETEMGAGDPVSDGGQAPN